MGGLGLFMRRRAISSEPLGNPLKDYVFYDKLRSNEGFPYICVPNFFTEGTDSCSFKYSNINKQYSCFVIGSRDTSNAITFLLYSASTVYSNIYNSSAKQIDHYQGYPQMLEVEIVWEGNRHNVKYNNVSWAQDTSSKTFSFTRGFYLFASNIAGTDSVDSRIFTGDIYYVVITDKDGNEKLHLTPCTYKGEPGMYDSVGDVFYGNAGSGKFIALND